MDFSPKENPKNKEGRPKRSLSRFERPLVHWLASLRGSIFEETSISKGDIDCLSFASRYLIYPPLLLLPSDTFASWPWPLLLRHLQAEQKQQLYAHLAASVSTKSTPITHVAINAPIPISINQTTNPPSAVSRRENLLRAPVQLEPLHGSFGPVPADTRALTHPSVSDVESALWVSTTQHRIHQVWAPLYTMFSRGNISEKERLVSLPSVRDAVQQGRADGRGCAAVDLYVGIGYFAFSYAAAGVSKVLGWEISGWSVEGLRRGARRNKWSVRVIEGETDDDCEPNASEPQAESIRSEDETLLIFHESNEYACSRIERLRKSIPPVRHVNCGLLPTSERSWATAVKVLDPKLGGWLHLHECIKLAEKVEKVQEILSAVEAVAQKNGRRGKEVLLEHVQRVKSYASKIEHSVLDIYIPPVAPG